MGRLYAIVPAAGAGSRMNSDTPKQYININGRSVLNSTLDRLLRFESLDSIVVVLDKAAYNADLFKHVSGKVKTCIGGSSRAESVMNGLQFLDNVVEADSSVLVHDAARPCVRVKDIKRLISEVASDENGGLLAIPVVDTIKRAGDDLRVTKTVDRKRLWRAATPQLFSYHLLLKALSTALQDQLEITDEASAMQHAGYSPKLVECNTDNIKITTATDLALAEHYLAVQKLESENAR